MGNSRRSNLTPVHGLKLSRIGLYFGDMVFFVKMRHRYSENVTTNKVGVYFVVSAGLGRHSFSFIVVVWDEVLLCNSLVGDKRITSLTFALYLHQSLSLTPVQLYR